jgi:DNA repair protein RadC
MIYNYISKKCNQVSKTETGVISMPLKSINIYTLKQVKDSAVQYDIGKHTIRSPETCYKAIQQILDLQSESVEKFGIITLTTKNKIAGIHIISIGTLDNAPVEPREVFKAAILNNAKAIIAFHNHPSGDPAPSLGDIYTSKLLKRSGKILKIALLDHIIIGDATYVSLKERKML